MLGSKGRNRLIRFRQRSLHMRPLLRLGPNVITDGTFTTLMLLQRGRLMCLGPKLFQIRPLLRLGPNVIMDGTFITLG